MSKKFGAIALLSFMFVFAFSFVAADLAVLGTIYEGGLGGSLSNGASVSVVCNGTTYTDTTGIDGQYAVLFNTTSGECVNGSTMDITYSKSGFNSFSGSKVIDYSKILSTASLSVITADHSLVSTTSSSSGGGSSGGGSGGSSLTGSICYSEFWDCGDWGECTEEGEQTRECISNCGSIKTERQICNPESDDSVGEEIGGDDLFSEVDGSDNAPRGGFFQAITGAVIGTLGTGGTFVAAIFIAIVIAGFVYTRSKAEEEEDDSE